MKGDNQSIQMCYEEDHHRKPMPHMSHSERLPPKEPKIGESRARGYESIWFIDFGSSRGNVSKAKDGSVCDDDSPRKERARDRKRREIDRENRGVASRGDPSANRVRFHRGGERYRYQGPPKERESEITGRRESVFG